MTKDDPARAYLGALADMTTSERCAILTRCSSVVEATAFHLVGTIEASLVARLISVAAVLERMAEEVRAASQE
ncbi:hypothetical protein [Roseovarius sp. 2305UL8-3]|uniref:hypothetical protein n=1 Tax=Roseovarius conchicola TaxID=3121636 RepID=UPI0035282C49